MVCFAALPFVNLLAANIGEPIELPRVALYWLGTTAVALLPVVIARPGRDSGQRLGVLISAFLFVFYNYPAATSLLGPWVPAPVLPGAWALGAAVVLGTALLVSSRPTAQTYVALVGVGLLVLPVGSLLRTAADRSGRLPPPTVDGERTQEAAVTPNIYFFVPDGYAGLDVVESFAGTDLTSFRAALEERGFRLSEAKANYPTTVTSLSSTLDMAYLVEDGARPDPAALRQRLEGRNRVVARLRALGYRYVHAYPGVWAGSRCSGDEDLCLGDSVRWSETDLAAMRMTPVSGVLGSDVGSRETLRRTSDPAWVVERARPWLTQDRVFLFVHLLAPHPPFLRDAGCQLRDEGAVQLDGWTEEDRTAYSDSVTCLNQQLLDAIDRILSADPEALIVLQADHGPSFAVEWDAVESWLASGGVEQRLSVLSAIRLPSACREASLVPEALTPVNTFRVVFACLDGTPPELLPDRHFFVPYEEGQPAVELPLGGGRVRVHVQYAPRRPSTARTVLPSRNRS